MKVHDWFWPGTRHQSAVDEGLNALHAITKDVEDYRALFLRLGKVGLTALQTPSCLKGVTGLENEWNALISPLALCAEDEVERKYLLSLALKRVIETALDAHSQAYQQALLSV